MNINIIVFLDFCEFFFNFGNSLKKFIEIAINVFQNFTLKKELVSQEGFCGY
jgi:hypothetical protein